MWNKKEKFWTNFDLSMRWTKVFYPYFTFFSLRWFVNKDWHGFDGACKTQEMSWMNEHSATNSLLTEASTYFSSFYFLSAILISRSRLEVKQLLAGLVRKGVLYKIIFIKIFRATTNNNLRCLIGRFVTQTFEIWFLWRKNFIRTLTENSSEVLFGMNERNQILWCGESPNLRLHSFQASRCLGSEPTFC